VRYALGRQIIGRGGGGGGQFGVVRLQICCQRASRRVEVSMKLAGRRNTGGGGGRGVGLAPGGKRYPGMVRLQVCCRRASRRVEVSWPVRYWRGRWVGWGLASRRRGALRVICLQVGSWTFGAHSGSELSTRPAEYREGRRVGRGSSSPDLRRSRGHSHCTVAPIARHTPLTAVK
jgi:hypothetical protein